MKNTLFLLFNTLVSLFLLLWFARCANPGSPTGGPKDTIPPTLLKATPLNRSTNFKGQEITLYFSEIIKADNFKSQLIITPRTEIEYEYKVTKNRLEIIFENELEPNTTYTFNFRESIKDITENNIYAGGVYAFSTGDLLDSLYIEGIVFDLFKKEPLKDIIVGLYPINDTINLFTSSPTYLTKTDKNGLYSIENVKEGEYKIYAFNDKNKNLKAESNSEEYGFISETLKIDTSYSNINIDIQRLDAREITIQSNRPSGPYYEIKFNKFITYFNLSDTTLIANFADNNKTIRIYNTQSIKDSIPITITAYDSINAVIKKEVFVSFPESQRKPEEFNQKFAPASGSQTNETFVGKFEGTKPIESIIYDSIFIRYDSITIDPITNSDLTYNNYKDQLTITKKLNLNNMIANNEVPPNYELYIGKGSFITVDGDSNQVIKGKYSLKKAEENGIIKGTVNIDAHNYIIQLLNSSYGIVEEIKNKSSYEFANVPPGEYMIRVMVDNNENGQWDPGNIHLSEEPEDVIYYEDKEENTKKIILRANWERGNIDIIE